MSGNLLLILLPLATFIISALLLFILRKVLISLFVKFTSKTETKLDDIVLLAIKRPSILWIFAVSLYISISFSKIPSSYSLTLTKIIAISIIISVTLALANLVGNIFNQYLRETSVSIPNTGLFQVIIKATIYVMGFLVALNYMGISIAPIITALGVGGLAVALAIKDTLSNLFSGIHIMVEKAIKVGDYIKIDNGVEGIVDDITWRTTRIKTIQNNFIIIPNEKIVQSVIINYDMQDKKLAVPVTVGVSYDSDIDKVESILVESATNVMNRMEEIAKDPKPVVRFNPGFSDSSIDFTIIVHANEFKSQFLIQSELRKEIFKRFKEEGIEIPFPQRVVHMKN